MNPRTLARYLRTVIELEEERIEPLRARVTDVLGLSATAVTGAVSQLRDAGFVEIDSPDYRIVLTPEGREIATVALRRHRLVESFLFDVIGMSWHELDREARLLEPVVGDFVISEMDTALGHPQRSPYGNPIPADGEVFPSPGDATAVIAVADPRRLVVGDAVSFAGRIAWYAESLQRQVPLMRVLGDHELFPGAVACFRVEERAIIASRRPEDPGVRLPRAAAAQILLQGENTACIAVANVSEAGHVVRSGPRILR